MQTGTGQDYAGSYVSLAIWSASPELRSRSLRTRNLLYSHSIVPGGLLVMS